MTLALPAPLAAAHELPFEYTGDESVDYEPYQEFMPADQTLDWLRAWTGNKDLADAPYRVFGQDGTGGYAAFWLVRPDAELTEQPVVFFGSEGELGLIAPDLAGYLWLLAGGWGPYEAVEYDSWPVNPRDDLRAIAEGCSPARRTPAEVVAAARAEFPDFEAGIRALVR